MKKEIIEKNGFAFAAGNFYKFNKIHKYEDGKIYIYGNRWIKAKKKFSGNGLIHYVGNHYEEIKENQLPN